MVTPDVPYKVSDIDSVRKLYLYTKAVLIANDVPKAQNISLVRVSNAYENFLSVISKSIAEDEFLERRVLRKRRK